ncbi:hypothetical protein PMAYCL1PPCAC_09650, partial [Pristionchus mayeri]
VYDIPAALRVERDPEQPVKSNSRVNGKWLEETSREQPLDDFPNTPPSNGWWRVDIIKLDEYRLNVFFQGYWSDVREFHMPLDRIKSVFVTSNNVKGTFLEVR